MAHLEDDSVLAEDSLLIFPEQDPSFGAWWPYCYSLMIDWHIDVWGYSDPCTSYLSCVYLDNLFQRLRSVSWEPQSSGVVELKAIWAALKLSNFSRAPPWAALSFGVDFCPVSESNPGLFIHHTTCLYVGVGISQCGEKLRVDSGQLTMDTTERFS